MTGRNTLLTLASPREAAALYAAGWWRDETLYALLARHAAARGERFALRDARHRLTWAALCQWVDGIAEELRAAGVRRGERVAVWLPSRAESVALLLACARNGYVCCPSLHQNYTVEEIALLTERCSATAIVLQLGYGAGARRVDPIARLRRVGSMRAVFVVSSPGRGHDERVRPLAAPTDDLLPCALPPDPDPDKIVYLAFTSGTTATPKGVMHSDNTLLANGRAMVRDWRVDERTIILSLSPLSHHIGTVAIEQMLVGGCELAVNDPPQGMQPIDWIVATGATYVMGVPTHAIDILGVMRERSWRALGSVRTFYMAGAPIPGQVARAFLDMGITPQNIYGMTENGSHQYTRPDDDATTVAETCGRAAPGYETRIFRQDNPDEEAPVGTIGEIGTRGALLMLGYFDDQGATERSFNHDGWFMSGDLGMLDERGALRIMGRKKDLVIRGGHNIHPARIEDLAHRHPDVAKAAAFGVPDERLGEKVCLAIIPRANARVHAEELLMHLHRTGLSKYDMPEFFVALEIFPLTASGKVLKRELAERARVGALALEAVRFVPPGEGRS